MFKWFLSIVFISVVVLSYFQLGAEKVTFDRHIHMLTIHLEAPLHQYNVELAKTRMEIPEVVSMDPIKVKALQMQLALAERNVNVQDLMLALYQNRSDNSKLDIAIATFIAQFVTLLFALPTILYRRYRKNNKRTP